jgi:hypothetical protein
MKSRRDFLRETTTFLGAMPFFPLMASEMLSKSKSVILRSSWQVENIGDIGHTPGVLALLEKYLPGVEVRLWPSNVGSGVEEMLIRRFPQLTILKTPDAINRALKECDFMLHGSGPFLVARNDLERWRRETGKPYGIFGITYPGIYSFSPDQLMVNPLDIDLMSNADFAYFRDSVSLEFASSKGVKSPVMGFCPDGAFAVDVRNDEAAIAFLKSHDLEEKNFVCAIPRLRFTPWWKVPARNQTVDETKHAWNEKMKEHDNSPIREAIIEVVRTTDLKVLIVPEDQTQIAVGKEMLYDPLPEDVKKRVVWRDKYWLTDEAVSTYIRSAGLFGLDMHSPIMCIGNGIPAIVCRFKEQTSKGIMWKDIGLGDWLFDMDSEENLKRIVPAVLLMVQNQKDSLNKVKKAMKFVKLRQKESLSGLKRALED